MPSPYQFFVENYAFVIQVIALHAELYLLEKSKLCDA